MDIHFSFWLIFIIIVCVMLYIDLYVTDHSHHERSLKSSAVWSCIWIGVALLFNASLYLLYDNGHEKAMEFLACYLVEKSLSVDNLFVFIMIFQALNIKRINQPHILKWGILGAIVFRVIFILFGIGLIEHFKVTICVFGLILLYAAFKMLKDALSDEEQTFDLNKSRIIKFIDKTFKIDTAYTGERFFTKIDGKAALTPLFVALIVIETADIVFATDSIPAVLAISHDPFIVITSNIMAVLGLRALYFVLSGMLGMFKYLKHGVALILFFVGFKMMIMYLCDEFMYFCAYKISVGVSLGIIFVTLTLSVILSIIMRKRDQGENIT
ncbi:MAG: TerC/Alx family metal homeostasis membrane protein [Spirochaetes bacterium]|nr:TerC/Alx family metal homeostasis membrane protein [Spirochaetota bacterium]